jgi:hypothetical protein
MGDSDQGIMTYFESEAHSFVIRLWRENRQPAHEVGEWRGWVEHVQSGQRHYFQRVLEISRIVGSYIGDDINVDEQVFLPVQPKDDLK